MSKKLTINIIICLLVFIITILIFYAGYRIADRDSADGIRSTFSPSGQLISAEETDKDSDFYIARFDGRCLSVYSVTDGKEEFLYSLKVRIEDISQKELTELKAGITLPTKQALASFEEDFTS